MSGRSCEVCFDKKLGYCPFDYSCKYEVIDLYAMRQKYLNSLWNAAQNNGGRK
jgi:hypothetical protein